MDDIAVPGEVAIISNCLPTIELSLEKRRYGHGG